LPASLDNLVAAVHGDMNVGMAVAGIALIHGTPIIMLNHDMLQSGACADMP
jgi:hypothetical protein